MSELNHALRRGRITSSTIAGCLGLDAKCSPLQAWERIMNPDLEPSREMLAIFERGNVLEDALLDWGARKAVERGDYTRLSKIHPKTTPHPKYDWAADSTDALYYENYIDPYGDGGGPDACGEAKTVAGFAMAGWGDEWTDEVPRGVALQCHWHLGHWPSTKCCYVPALIGFGMNLRIFVIERDEDIAGALFEAAEKFHRAHVRTGIPPDATRPTDSEVIARLFPIGAGEMLPDPALEMLVRRHVSLQEMIAPLDRERDTIGAQIKQRLGDHELARGEDWKVSHKNSKPRTETDWPAVIAELRKCAMGLPRAADFFDDLDDLIQLHTTTKVGSRRLLTHIDKKKDA